MLGLLNKRHMVRDYITSSSGKTIYCILSVVCNCHGHASDCYYDAEVDYQQASLDIHGQYNGGGVCINCQVLISVLLLSLFVFGFWNIPISLHLV